MRDEVEVTYSHRPTQPEQVIEDSGQAPPICDHLGSGQIGLVVPGSISVERVSAPHDEGIVYKLHCASTSTPSPSSATDGLALDHRYRGGEGMTGLQIALTRPLLY